MLDKKQYRVRTINTVQEDYKLPVAEVEGAILDAMFGPGWRDEHELGTGACYEVTFVTKADARNELHHVMVRRTEVAIEKAADD